MKPPIYASRPSVLQYWFPVLLGILLLLCVPGYLLLLLHLLGEEIAVNGWMQQHFSLSYHIRTPWWAVLLLLLLPFLIALLYFLKLKRKPIQVPSTYLWKKSIEDMHVNSFFQWLRKNVLLLIQVLIVLCLIYSVMAFQFHGSTEPGNYYILMIDSSASMSVADGTPTRLDAAKQAALNEINIHGDNDIGMVIEFNSVPTIRQGYTTDRGLLRLAVNKIVQTQRVTRLEEALRLADGLANPKQSTDDVAVRPPDADPAKARTYVAAEGLAIDVHLFSDGRFPDVADFAVGNLNLKFHSVGKADQENIGIVDFRADRDEEVPGKVRVFVRILNFGSKPAKARVELEVRGKNPADYKRYVQPDDEQAPFLSLDPRVHTEGNPETGAPDRDKPGEAIVNFELNDIDDSDNVVLHTSLLGNNDAFKLDDQAWLVLGVVRKARICIVTPGNDVLHKFFDQEATAKVASVTYLTPDKLTSETEYQKPARDGAFDLIIFDRCAPPPVAKGKPEEAMPLANTFFIADVPPPWKVEKMLPMKDTVIRNPTSPYPLMRNLTGLDEIAFSEAFVFDPKTLDEGDANDKNKGPRLERLLETGKETAALFTMSRGSFTDVVMTFPLVKDINGKPHYCTNWWLKLSFPIFMRNLVFTYGRVSLAGADDNVQPGTNKSLRPDTTERRIEVYGPKNPDSDPERVQRGSQGDFVYNNTEQVGVYRVTWAGGEHGFAVNLLDAAESNIQPRDKIAIGTTTLTPGQTAPLTPSQERRSVRETWKWPALGALALLLLEYALYHRRVFG